MGPIRGEPRGQPRRSPRTGPRRDVSSVAIAPEVHTEGRWQATAARHRSNRGQDCPGGGGGDPQPIYEAEFLGFSYGFRPGRGQHDALDALAYGIRARKINWILDSDIRSFFDTISPEWLVRFIEHRIGDRRIIRLIQKWLKAGVLEGDQWIETTEGTPQGAVASPLLANVYLHYVYDRWVQQWRKRHATGDMIVVRYADDTIVGFQHRRDAERFLSDLKNRLAQFALSLHPEKTRLIEICAFAAERRQGRGEGKPETFDFLGFTHYCGTRKDGAGYQLGRRTQRKRMRAKIKEI